MAFLFLKESWEAMAFLIALKRLLKKDFRKGEYP